MLQRNIDSTKMGPSVPNVYPNSCSGGMHMAHALLEL